MDNKYGYTEIFEAWGELYYKRFHRLCPGKSEAAETRRDSNDEKNRAQYAEWFRSGQAYTDAIEEVIRLNKELDKAREPEELKGWS